MEKIIQWKSEEDKSKNLENREILIEETKEVTTSHIITLANKERDLQLAKQHRDNAQKIVDEFEAEITEIKQTLGIIYLG